uniref:NAD(P)H dehydrogenase (Quinone) n=1 Tax=Geobacter sp. (strain M21) TaxID=443144 RepID=C6E1F3_GEOSM
MKNILILFAHPRYEKSRTNKALIDALKGQEGITVHDLYELYPDFNIDVAREQELLLTHQIIVWHYPLFLYGAPAMIKQWMDLVLEHGWAHGAGVKNLVGKEVLATITSGGSRESYSHSGFNRHTMPELLFPLKQAANLCRMTWLPPFVVQGTYRLTDGMLAEYGHLYRQVLQSLAQSPPLESIRGCDFLNDWIADRRSSHDG